MADQEFMLSVIELYKNSPCLWQPTHNDYQNKTKKNEAFIKLLKLFRTKNKTANLDTVKKKISSLRNCFKKELNKVKASLRSGCGAEDVHIPKLWYYNHLLFLADVDTPRRRRQSFPNSMLDDTASDDNAEVKSEANHYLDGTQSPVSIYLQSPSSSQSSVHSLSMSSAVKRANIQADAVLAKISKKLKSKPTSKSKYSAYGEHIAEKLRGMPPLMATYCQKIINDAIFMAETNNLLINSHIVNK